ncbi:hypothetical protein evm_008694 [Chilo suppressalis]|nr:hypothetical protein evm_008694 [Chilo suppressalis]
MNLSQKDSSQHQDQARGDENKQMIFPFERSIDGVTILIYSLGMTQYFVILLITVMAGQKLQNAWKALMKSLSILRILFIKNPEIKQTKSLRDLVRLVNLEPLRVQLISSLPLDMTLVPVSISLIVSYIIVLLQLNKII